MSKRHPAQVRTLRVLSTAQVVNGIGVSSTIAAGSLLVNSMAHSDSIAGLAQTMSVLGAALMAIPLARLTNRGGRRYALLSGYGVAVTGAVTVVVAGAAGWLVVTLGGILLLGAASASSYQARFAALDLATHETKSRDLSLVVWGSTIGSVAGPNLLAPAGHLAASWGLPNLTGPYIVAATAIALSVLIVGIFLRPDPFLLAREQAGASSAERPALRTTLRHIMNTKGAALGAASISVGHLAMVAVMVMTPVHMKHMDVSLTVIGLVISVHVLGMFAFSPAVGWCADRWGSLRVVRLGVVVLLAATVVAGLAPPMGTTQLMVGLFLLGLGWSCTLIAGSTMLSSAVSNEFRSSSQGSSDLVMNLMGALGGVIGGLVISTWSYGWLCALVALPVGVLGLSTLRHR
ncbi:MAG: MFS transporter [Acidobacteria bacterium]|nr:MFS transporter [Acidobacteriota bacterium]